MKKIGAVDACASLITPEAVKFWPKEFLHVLRGYKVEGRLTGERTRRR
jgi:hypothetical protein